MAASFKAQKIRTSAIIGSGSFVSSRPSILIYSASVADVNGDLTDTGVYTKVGKDAFLFVSGTVGGKGTTGVSAFGGDVVISGTIYNASGTPYSVSGGSPDGSNKQVQFNDAGSFRGDSGLVYDKNTATLAVGSLNITGSYLVVTGSTYITGSTTSLLSVGRAELSTDSSNDFYLNNTAPGKLSYFGVTTTGGVTTNFLRARPNSSPENTLVSFLQSLGGHNTVTPLGQTDTNFFVGGKIGAIGGATRGTAVFAGDLVISGSAQLLSNSVLKADLLPDGNRTRNLGSDSLRFANVYTGDLHLKNERGDYTLIEEEDCLTIRFNKTGKRYRFMLERAPEFDEDPGA
jgi:hypothetical protein